MRGGVWVCLWWLIATAVIVHASLLDDDEDDTAMLRRTLRRMERERSELHGYMHHNATQQGNFTLHRDQDPHLDAIQASWKHVRSNDATYYRNISAFFRGNFTAYNTSDSTKTQRRERGDWLWWHRTPTSSYALSAEPVAHTNVSRVWGEMVLRAFSFNGTLSMTAWDMAGVHDPSTGRLYMVGAPQTSPIPLDMRQVLALLPSSADQLRNDTYTACLADLEDRIARVKSMLAESTPITYTPTLGQASHNCTLQLYGQEYPAGPASEQASLDWILREMNEPRGIVVPRAPNLVLDMAAVSSRCGLYLESREMEAVPRAVFWGHARYYVVGMALVLLLQLVLMSKECERVQTHSDYARLASGTWFIQTNCDAFLSLGHFMAAFQLEGALSLAMMALGFMSGTLFMVFEYRLLVAMVRQSMEEERARVRDTPPHPEATEATSTAWSRDWMNRSRTQVRANMRSVLSNALVVAFFVMSFAAPELLGYILLPILCSFWVPQIVHNVRRGSTGLQPSTVIGMTLTRCYMPLYLFQYPDNLFKVETSPYVWIPILWCLCQMLVLLGQHYLGPRFFVPSAMRRTERQWHWHPSPTELAALLPSHDDLPESASPAMEDPASIPLGDCPICLMPNDWTLDETWTPPTSHGSWRAWGHASTTRPSGVMVTPCRHIFHTSCLMPWMNIKHMCPSCRLPLPEYEV